MSEIRFHTGDVIRFNYTIRGVPTVLTGKIQTVDFKDPETPYYVHTDNGGYWVQEEEVVELLDNEQLDRIEAKLDAIIAHLNVPLTL